MRDYIRRQQQHLAAQPVQAFTDGTILFAL
jgi:hypothetical protein